MPLPAAETPPQGLSAHWLGVWRHCIKVAKRQKTWTWEQAPLLVEYIEALREADTARSQAKDDPWHETEQGLIHPHPGFAIADRSAKRAQSLAKTLCLMPAEQEALRKSRAKLPEPDPKPKSQEERDAEAFEGLDDELAERRKAREGASA